MNDKEKLQYLYEKEKERENKQEKRQGQILFAGGMATYSVAVIFKIIVMSFFPLLFFYFILEIDGISLVVLSLIAGAFFFYIKEGQDIKEEMGNRAMMEECRNERLLYSNKEFKKRTMEAEEKERKEMEECEERFLTEEEKREMGLIPEENNFNQKSLYVRKSIANALGCALLIETDKALNSMPVVRNYLKQHGLKSAEDIPYLRKVFYSPLADDAEELGKIINKYGFVGAVAEENNLNVLESWTGTIETIEDNCSLLENIFDQAIREAMKIGRRESYKETVFVLGDLKKHFDYHSEKEWRDHVGNMEEKEKRNLKIHKTRLLTENEKREIGLVL